MWACVLLCSRQWQSELRSFVQSIEVDGGMSQRIGQAITIRSHDDVSLTARTAVHRLVVDEPQDLSSDGHEHVTNIVAYSRWVLCGTPNELNLTKLARCVRRRSVAVENSGWR